MVYRPRVRYASEAEYRDHFERVYCKAPIATHDGIEVRFKLSQFKHAFYEGDFKSGFSKERAERIDWIGEALRDDKLRLYMGWDSSRRTFHQRRRVSIAGGNYVVIIEIDAKDKKVALFITAYDAASG